MIFISLHSDLRTEMIFPYSYEVNWEPALDLFQISYIHIVEVLLNHMLLFRNNSKLKPIARGLYVQKVLARVLRYTINGVLFYLAGHFNSERWGVRWRGAPQGRAGENI